MLIKRTHSFSIADIVASSRFSFMRDVRESCSCCKGGINESAGDDRGKEGGTYLILQMSELGFHFRVSSRLVSRDVSVRHVASFRLDRDGKL